MVTNAGDAKGNSTLPRTTIRKAFHSKTKTGCLTCRIRRVKCDEATPDCRKCSGTGRKCDGYFDGPPVKTKTSTSIHLPPPVPHPRHGFSGLEGKAFEFFRHRTAAILSGHFSDETYDKTALQLYHTEPAVRYTINAFGALHQEFHSRTIACNAGVNAQLRSYFPAEQYSHALRELQSMLSLSEVPLEVVLVCSVLLAQYEAVQTDFLPAMVHAEKALGLLVAGRKRLDETFLRTMMRFDAQSAMLVGRRAPQLTIFASDLDRDLPPAISSGVEARHLVTTWSSRLYAFSQAVADRYVVRPGNVALEHLAEAQALERVFLRLDGLLRTYQSKQSGAFSAREQHGIAILRARTKIRRMFAATSLYGEATMFDAYSVDFEEILGICEELLADPRADRRLFVLHIDEGLMHPLYTVATYCRDSRIRRRALELLKHELPVGNGSRVWHAEVVIRTAELIIDYEEAGTPDLKCRDVPECRRVHDASFENWDTASWHQEVGGPLRVMPNGMDGGWMLLEELRAAQGAVLNPHEWPARGNSDICPIEQI